MDIIGKSSMLITFGSHRVKEIVQRVVPCMRCYDQFKKNKYSLLQHLQTS